MQPNVKYTVYFIFKQVSVNSTNRMFCGCLSLISADFTLFNTENVINMSYMFSGCWALKELDLSKFDTTKVTDMANMFEGWTSCQQVFLPSTCVEKKKRCIWYGG